MERATVNTTARPRQDAYLGRPWLSERKFDVLNGYVGQGNREANKESQELYKKYDALLEHRREAGDPPSWLYRVQTA